MCTLAGAVALGEAIGSTKARHLENREVQVAPFRGLFSAYFLQTHTCIAQN